MKDMKKIILLICFLICVFKVSAENNNALVLHMANGKQVTYLLDELPVVTFNGEDLVVTTHLNLVTYQARDVAKFTYSYIDPSIVVGLKNANTMFKFDGDVLYAYNLEPFSTVSIYSVDGTLIISAKTGTKGDINISLPQVSGCVYVVKTSVANFKLMKP